MLMSLCNREFCNMSAEHLKKILLSCAEKSENSRFAIILIIMAGASLNRKLERSLLKEKGENSSDKKHLY